MKGKKERGRNGRKTRKGEEAITGRKIQSTAVRARVPDRQGPKVNSKAQG